MIHGTPGSVNEHLYHDTPEEKFQELAKNAAADIIVFGHSHEPFTKKAGGALFINPGGDLETETLKPPTQLSRLAPSLLSWLG